MSRWCLYLRRVAVVWRVASLFQRLSATACVARIVRTPLSSLKSACVPPCKGCSLATNLSRPSICSASPSVVLMTSLSWCELLSVAGRSAFRRDLGKRKRERRWCECMVLSVLLDATVQAAICAQEVVSETLNDCKFCEAWRPNELNLVHWCTRVVRCSVPTPRKVIAWYVRKSDAQN